MTYSTVLLAIHNKLTAITAIKAVYDYDNKHATNYPVACIIGADFNDTDLDNKTKWRQWDFTINIYHTIETDPATTETTMSGIVVSIMDAFATDYSLTGACTDCKVAGVRSWLEREMDMRITTVRLSIFGDQAI